MNQNPQNALEEPNSKLCNSNLEKIKKKKKFFKDEDRNTDTWEPEAKNLKIKIT